MATTEQGMLSFGFPTYLQIDIEEMTKGEFCEEFQNGEARSRLDRWAMYGLHDGKGMTYGEEETVTFTRVKVSDLNLSKSTSMEDIVARIEEYGQSPCKPHDAFFLQRHFLEEGVQEDIILYTAMTPLQCTYTTMSYVFYVYRTSPMGRTHIGAQWEDKTYLKPDNEIVFRLRS